MKYNKIIKSLFSMLIIVYIVIYIASSTGYYEYRNYKKMILTEEQINKFEDDIKEGKEINLEEYVVNEDNNYDNKLSKLGRRLSFTISDTCTNILSKTFKSISKFITE